MGLRIKREIEEFIRRPNAEVLVIKGGWGVGKTYFWDSILNDLRESDEKSDFLWYSYVSLFGVDSLDKLKITTFEGMQPLKITMSDFEEIEFSFKQILNKKFWMACSDFSQVRGFYTKEIKGKKAFDIYQKFKPKGKAGMVAVARLAKFASEIPLIKNYIGETWRLGWVAIEKTIVCVDDLERASGSLDLKDAFGLISQLKEIKKCKVIIILNDSELKKNSPELEAYETYREKIVDIELTYTPDTQDVAKLILNEVKDEHYALIIENAEKLSIKNLRTFQRIKQQYEKIEDLIEQQSTELQRDILSALVFFTYIHFTPDGRFPTAEQMIEISEEQFQIINISGHISSRGGEVKSEEDEARIKKYTNVNDIYGWSSINNVEKIIGKFVKDGWLDDIAFQEESQNANAEYSLDNERKSLSGLKEEIIQYAYHSFETDNDALLSMMKNVLVRSSKIYPSSGLLGSYVVMLRTLGEVDRSKELIEFYISTNKEMGSEYFEFEAGSVLFQGTDQEDLLSAMNKEFSDRRSLEIDQQIENASKDEIFKSLIKTCGRSFPDDEDMHILSKFSEEDFEKLILENIASKKIDQLIRFLLESGATEQGREGFHSYHKIIARKLRAALRKIGQEKEKAEYLYGRWNIKDKISSE